MAANHGSSPAAWTTVMVVIVGFLVGGLALVLGSSVGVAAGAAIVLAGAVVGKIMQLMGLGKRPLEAPSHRADGMQVTGGEEGRAGLAESGRAR